MTNSNIPRVLCVLAASIAVPISLQAQPAPPAGDFARAPGVLALEAEDFKPEGSAGWRTIQNGQGNYMVDIIGYSHISGERVLSGAANSKGARATATVQIPASGTYRVWSRFEQPTGMNNQFRVEIRQNGRIVASGLMGERDAPKWFPGGKEPVGQADFSWGSEGLVEQSFDATGLQSGPAQITLVAVDQPAPSANRNVDLLYLTQDLANAWRVGQPSSPWYPILDAAKAATPPRYYVRLTSPQAQTIAMGAIINRIPWNQAAAPVKLEANVPSAWIPLTVQELSHYGAWVMSGNAPAGGLQLRAEFASAPDAGKMLRVIDWNDPKSNQLVVALPPYPNKYAGEKIMTVEEQYRDVANFLKNNPTKVGRDPILPLAWGSSLPVFERGRDAAAAADVYFGSGMRGFVGWHYYNRDLTPALEKARERFAERGLAPNRHIALGAYRNPPTPEAIKTARENAEKAGVLNLVQRFDYGDEIGFSEWLNPIKPEELNAKFVEWQQKKHGAAPFAKPDSSAQASKENPRLFFDSQQFYEEAAIEHVAEMAKELPKAFGPEILYGANVAAHPFYYPEIAKYIKWFRGGAANFGRHSEYFWQVGQPGPLINGYIADHFTAGMRDNPQATLQQYSMPHSPGNAGNSFRRTAFTHMAHGSRVNDYFGMGINSSWTENHIDFRDKDRYAAIREINRSVATVEDIMPTSRPTRTKVALILSDSTERWDTAGIALDRANFNNFGDGYKATRLAYHHERVGTYYALVHGSRPADLLTEEDVQAGRLQGYEVAHWTGDCAEPATVASLRGWVEGGGHLVATAGALRLDQYRQPVSAGNALLGLATAQLDERDRFFRPQIEMPRLKPLDMLGAMPALAFVDNVTAAPGARVIQAFASGKPAIIQNTVGRGRTTFIATLPGVAYLKSAYPSDLVPSRGPASHQELDFNRAIGTFIAAPARATMSFVDAGESRIDARLLESPNVASAAAIVVSNYNTNVREPVTLTIRVAGAKGVSSAVAGRLKFKTNADGSMTVRYVPGYGDILRVER